MMRISVPARIGLFTLILFVVGCKEGTVGPSLSGSVTGTVLDYESTEPIAGASITTSPPTNAIVTDQNGRFEMEELEAGNYTIHAKRPGYQNNSVTVRVRENRTAQATIFLEVADEEDEETAPEMSVEITNWWNSTSGDSAFVNVEYRVRNTGTEAISAYEIYFRIASGTQNFYHEETGTTLPPNQADLRQFERYIPTESADSVMIEDYWVE